MNDNLNKQIDHQSAKKPHQVLLPLPIIKLPPFPHKIVPPTMKRPSKYSACEQFLTELFGKQASFIAVLLLSYLDFQTVHQSLSKASSNFRKLMTQSQHVDTLIWKQLYLEEFHHIDYPDHSRGKEESYRSYYKRSFQQFKCMRTLIEGIIRESNLRRLPNQQQTGFLRSFHDRRAPKFFFIEEKVTFQIECLYKCYQDCDEERGSATSETLIIDQQRNEVTPMNSDQQSVAHIIKSEPGVQSIGNNIFKNVQNEAPCATQLSNIGQLSSQLMIPNRGITGIEYKNSEMFAYLHLNTLSFNKRSFTTVLLTPSAIQNFRSLLQMKCNIKCFPITHLQSYRQASFIDINNIMGRGVNAIYSATGYDKSTFLQQAASIEELLTKHYQSLAEDRFYVDPPIGGEITVFRKNPQEIGGSLTVTQGLKVEAQAVIHHMFCRFDKQIFDNAPKYFFVYQVRISVLPQISSAGGPGSAAGSLIGFRPCKLISRHWRFKSQTQGRSCAGKGIIGRFPCFVGPQQETLVYQNCIEIDDLNSIMEGYYTFRYLKQGEAPNEEPENLQDIDPALLFRVDVAPLHLKLQPGQLFVPNPNFQPYLNTI